MKTGRPCLSPLSMGSCKLSVGFHSSLVLVYLQLILRPNTFTFFGNHAVLITILRLPSPQLDPYLRNFADSRRTIRTEWRSRLGATLRNPFVWVMRWSKWFCVNKGRGLGVHHRHYTLVQMSYAPTGESATALFNERTSLIGAILSGVGYGQSLWIPLAKLLFTY